MLLDGVFYLVQLLPYIVSSVVIRCRVSVAALLSAPSDAPIEHSYEATDPRHC